MKIIFMGTPEFSVPTLEALIQSEHEVIAVVTQPDKPKGRKRVLTAPPIKELALEHGIPVLQPVKASDPDFVKELKNLDPDMMVVIAFGQILRKAVLDIPKYGCINIHASLLPTYRGSAPINWVVVEGEQKTGITTMYMDTGIDTGDMLLKEEILIDEKETAGSLHDKLKGLGGDLIIKTIDALVDGSVERIPQNQEQSSYFPLLSKELGHIDWSKDAFEIERLIRGLNPWPSAYTYFDHKMLKLWSAEVKKDHKFGAVPGTVTEIIRNKGFLVQCGKGSLFLTEVQLQGKKRMGAGDFLRGVSIQKNDVLDSRE